MADPFATITKPSPKIAASGTASDNVRRAGEARVAADNAAAQAAHGGYQPPPSGEVIPGAPSVEIPKDTMYGPTSTRLMDEAEKVLSDKAAAEAAPSAVSAAGAAGGSMPVAPGTVMASDLGIPVLDKAYAEQAKEAEAPAEKTEAPAQTEAKDDTVTVQGDTPITKTIEDVYMNQPVAAQGAQGDPLGGLLTFFGKAFPGVLGSLLGGLDTGLKTRAGVPELSMSAQNQARLLQSNQLENQRWLAENSPAFQALANIAQEQGTTPYEMLKQIIPSLTSVGTANIGAQANRDVAGINQATQRSLPGIQSSADISTYKGLMNPKATQAQRMLNIGMGGGAGDGTGSGNVNWGPQALAGQFKTDPRAAAQSLLTSGTKLPTQPNSPAEAANLANAIAGAAR